ncbi:DUF6051 family protein [Lutibacter sp. B1]|uniref:DUF6051 family protein n=1 Tax=Lutibacter sp. B1 TaxID=2725996 RepID=UPI0014578821|nr:DUF6051 family protein [Lutibacter sp. B1]NLP58427.1 hypothetical protein [Lutibacter sp. B1]
MRYTKSYLKLKEAFLTGKSFFEIDTVSIHKFDFYSESHNMLPGNEHYKCEKHRKEFDNTISYYNDIGTIINNVQIKDVEVQENQNFNYYILKPKESEKISKVTFLFHGLNEKTWDKYLPWGKYICEKTQSAIVFFPIAFHMQRAPLSWSEKRQMFILSEQRKKKFPNIINSSLSNVAISMRLHSMPQRIIWSGLQTYYDVIQFIEECKNDEHSLIDKDFTFNIFAYSIGGLLAEILKLSNYKNYFSNTKLCLFCAGAVINRFSPVSKFILDSEANIAMYSYLAEHFASFLKKDALLNHYINEDHFEGKVFHSMLEYQNMRVFREDLFKKVEDHIYAITLKNDTIIPSFEVINTLQGAFRNIDIKVDDFDFDYKYTHENPFPVDTPNTNLVDESFEYTFNKVCEFLNS